LDVIFPYASIAPGQNWPAIREALGRFVEVESRTMPEGRSVVNLPAVPFPFEVVKASNQLRGAWFMRQSPSDDSLPQRLRALLIRKASKLRSYAEEGWRTVLLLESDDVALMNKEKLLDALRLAFPSSAPLLVDEVWYADTSIPNATRFFDL